MGDAGAPALDERFAQVRTIERAARQILDVTRELGRAGRREPRQPLLVETVWLPVLWREIGAACAQLPRPAGVVLQWHSPAPDASISSDRWRVGSVVRNLVSSALEATVTGVVRAECAVAGGMLSIVVRDPGCNGPGDGHTRDGGPWQGGSDALPGRGVGLATVRRVVAELGGAMSLAGEVDGGSEVRVLLPLVLPRAVRMRGTA